MKNLKRVLLFLFIILVGMTMTSCVIKLSEHHKDNGKHKGWYKTNGNHNGSHKNKHHHDYHFF